MFRLNCFFFFLKLERDYYDKMCLIFLQIPLLICWTWYLLQIKIVKFKLTKSYLFIAGTW